VCPPEFASLLSTSGGPRGVAPMRECYVIGCRGLPDWLTKDFSLISCNIVFDIFPSVILVIQYILILLIAIALLILHPCIHIRRVYSNK
jgi:hypothetical protein